SLQQGPLPRLQARQAQPVRAHRAASARERVVEGGDGLLRRQARRVPVPRAHREEGHERPLHLGPHHPLARQLGRRPRKVPPQPPAACHGRLCPCHAVPVQHL
ncbi:hypothetical protein IWQ57_004513, partial [Coemansia nantahalensis]